MGLSFDIAAARVTANTILRVCDAAEDSTGGSSKQANTEPPHRTTEMLESWNSTRELLADASAIMNNAASLAFDMHRSEWQTAYHKWCWTPEAAWAKRFSELDAQVAAYEKDLAALRLERDSANALRKELDVVRADRNELRRRLREILSEIRNRLDKDGGV